MAANMTGLIFYRELGRVRYKTFKRVIFTHDLRTDNHVYQSIHTLEVMQPYQYTGTRYQRNTCRNDVWEGALLVESVIGIIYREFAKALESCDNKPQMRAIDCPDSRHYSSMVYTMRTPPRLFERHCQIANSKY